MGSLYIPNQRVDTVDMGTSPVNNPSNLMLEIDGVVYGSGYLNKTSVYQRQIYPVYDAGTNKIYLKIINYAISGQCPSLTISNIKVLVID
jgi:hypothetical protein